jgi:cellulose synthase operon protein C
MPGPSGMRFPTVSYPRDSALVFLFASSVFLAGAISAQEPAAPASNSGKPRLAKVAVNRPVRWQLTGMQAGHTYSLSVSLRSGTLGNVDHVRVAFQGPNQTAIEKDLHAGDPDLYTHYRPTRTGSGFLQITSMPGAKGEIPVELVIRELPITANESVAFDPGPNDLKTAAPLILGRSVYGAVDELDYLDNQREGENGLRWYRIDYADDQPALVYLWLDVLDRDVSVNLRMYRADPRTGRVQFYPCKPDGSQARYDPSLTHSGIDPMEIIHDREGNPLRGREERYSKHISRVLTKGTYYLEVNANHPDYILRSRKLPVPPYTKAEDAVEAGMQYIMNVGDAWFAQTPREGAIYRRVQNMHETALRCTACHPSVFSTEANLVAHRNGYPIRSKENFWYVVTRLYNSMAPLYGHDGLYYQRFISIPFQSQGKQGGVILDYENEISGVPSKTFLRFGPFLKAGWADRTDLPPDELNGVVPRDSKFGFAWRDWRVLQEIALRAKDPGYARVADHLADLLSRPESKNQIAEKTNPYGRSTAELQDRMHRLVGLATAGSAWPAVDVIKPTYNPGLNDSHRAEIRQECEKLLTLQNAEGGWAETTEGGASAVYATGQMLVTLMTAGVNRGDSRLQKGFRYLLGQQENFGGWFQTTTSENFRTPMRETRYVVEALAMGFPRKAGPLTPDPSPQDAEHNPILPSLLGGEASGVRGWGNRDDQPARLPRTDSMLHTLDDLDNLWEVPKGHQIEFIKAIVALLKHEQPLIRARAAECLGRIAIGCNLATAPLVEQLNHPNKLVWRAAAWALRNLGDFGTGVEEIRRALDSPDPLVRRGACRIFAYQFFGMDERLDLCDRLIELTGDRDFWTRLQAIKTLRQWFYRTDNPAQQRKIVEAFIARMGAAGEPAAVRANLWQGMYIMLDENLNGGVHLTRTLHSMPASIRERAVADREQVEKEILLGPIFAALANGNSLQREALVNSFDGSFLKGRFYARNPQAMIDVGNDREFGFLYNPPQSLLDRTFLAIFDHETNPRVRRSALRLADFFLLPARSANGQIQRIFLQSLSDPDVLVRSAASEIAAKDLALNGAAGDAELIDLIRKLLRHPRVERAALVPAIARNQTLLEDSGLRQDLRGQLRSPGAWRVLLPVLRQPAFHDGEVLAVIDSGWSESGDFEERVKLLDLLASRKTLIDQQRPAEKVVQFLRRGATDPSVGVRERTFNLLAGVPKLWNTPLAGRLLYIGLADDSPTVRLQCLKLGEGNADLWKRAETSEYILRLLIDPDRKIRREALAAVERHDLSTREPRILRRLRGVMADADAELARKAESILRAHHVDPSTISADVIAQRPRILNLSYFRREVNPLFYQPGADGEFCAKCHVNHTILRLAETPAPGKYLTIEDVMLNYNSALKVVNLGDPEQSLILRKPRSPHGQGEENSESPTGLTHVGGPRWESTQHPAYLKFLTWIRSASAAAVHSSSHGRSVSADSYSPDHPPGLVLDGDPGTFWHTEYIGAMPGYPHELVVDLGRSQTVGGLLYVPRTDGSSNGRVKDYEIYVSQDGKKWGKPLAKGVWTNDAATKYVSLPPTPSRYVKLRGLSEVNNQPYMSAAEIVVDVE